jgi:two-component system, response regulator PdtaR
MAEKHQSRPRVLVVEDDALIRMDAVDMLESAGFDVSATANADEAVKLLETDSAFVAIFTDIEMPGSIDGLRLAHAVKDRWPPIKILATSGHARFRAVELPQGGMFVSKPYTSDQVTKALRDLIAA